MSNVIDIHQPSEAMGPGPRLIPTRTLFSRGSQPGELQTTQLEAVRDLLKKQRDLQEPKDFDRSFSHMHLNYTGGRVTAQFLDPNGLQGSEMLVHDNAYRQMGSNLLPTRFGQGLLEQAGMGDTGEKLSTMSWALWSQQNETPRMFRTVLTRDQDGTVQRVIRSQHSQGYAVYDNFQFVQDLLDNAPDLATMPVLDMRVTDIGMRLRFCTEDVGQFALNKPMPIIEAWNSEAGRRRTVLHGGMWKLWCTNGCGTWDSKSEFAWRHFGNTDRIRDGVASAITEIRTAASGVVEVYNSALDIAIDDAFAFMERELKREGLTKAQIGKAQTGLEHETTTPGGCLASTVDAVTLIAQEYDLFTQGRHGAGCRAHDAPRAGRGDPHRRPHPDGVVGWRSHATSSKRARRPRAIAQSLRAPRLPGRRYNRPGGATARGALSSGQWWPAGRVSYTSCGSPAPGDGQPAVPGPGEPCHP